MGNAMSPRLRRARAAVDGAERELVQARTQLHRAIADELRAGARPTDVATAAGLTTARVRQIARAAGVPAPARWSRETGSAHPRRAS